MTTQDPTTNYSWDLPTVGGSTGSWGTELNTIIGDDATGIDAVLKAVSDVADAALPKAGGTMTGLLTGHTITRKISALGTVNGATDLDLSVANVFTATTNAATTFTVSNVPASGLVEIWLSLTNMGLFTITWPSVIMWASGNEPGWTNTGTDIVRLLSFNNGTTWFGYAVILDVKP